MKLEYRYGQTYLIDLHLGDIVSISDGEYRIVAIEDIDKDGCLKINTRISTKIDDRSE